MVLAGIPTISTITTETGSIVQERVPPSERVEAPTTAVRLEDVTRLMTWLSPAFPVGAFSYSHGLEWVVETRAVRDAVSLADWIRDLLEHGAPKTDLMFLAEAWRAVASGDMPRLADVAELAAAFVPSAERRLETIAQGNAFVLAMRNVWPSAALEELKSREVAYPVAVGAAAAAHGLDLTVTARCFAQAFVANVVSAGVRLVPLGQTDGLRVVADLERAVAAVVDKALGATLDDVGGAAVAADIGSMLHETQYTRLFRS